MARRRSVTFLCGAIAGASLVLPPEPHPGPRNAHGAVYDLRDGALVLFGGASANEVRGDTWRWKAGVWSRLDGEGPGRRTFPAMAFDAARGEAVLFGGNRVLFGDADNPARMLADTWVLRSGTWHRRAVSGPSPRAEAAMAYDSRREVTVLFGGRTLAPGGNVRLGDTWEWDGMGWRLADTTGPTPRSGAAMAFDPSLRKIVLFGGSGGPLGDTWTWDGRRWIPLDVPAAPGRFNTAMAADPRTGRLVRFGGWDGRARCADTWELRDEGWVRVDEGGVPARNHTVLVAATDRGSVVLYGGHDGDRVFGDLWERRDGVWMGLERGEPVARVANGH